MGQLFSLDLKEKKINHHQDEPWKFERVFNDAFAKKHKLDL